MGYLGGFLTEPQRSYCLYRMTYWSEHHRQATEKETHVAWSQIITQFGPCEEEVEFKWVGSPGGVSPPGDPTQQG